MTLERRLHLVLADSLNKLWEREIEKISPEGDPLNIFALIQYLMERINNFLEKLIPTQSPIHMPNVTPRSFSITIAVILFCLFIALIIKKYGSSIRETISSFIPRDEFSDVWNEFHSLVVSGSHANALRFFVRALSSIYKFAHFTFSEIFPSIGNSPAASVKESYGRIIHKNGNISRDEIEKFTAHAVIVYPRAAKSHSSIFARDMKKK
jgi:hypothetical protein